MPTGLLCFRPQKLRATKARAFLVYIRRRFLNSTILIRAMLGEGAQGRNNEGISLKLEAGEVVENAAPEPYVLPEVPEEPEVLEETNVPGNLSSVGREEHAETQAFNEEEAGMPDNGETRPRPAPNEVNGKAHGESRVQIILGHKQL